MSILLVCDISNSPVNRLGKHTHTHDVLAKVRKMTGRTTAIFIVSTLFTSLTEILMKYFILSIV